jgi:PAS domain S-box-containing protein
MAYQSPHPPVAIPDIELTAFVFARSSRWLTKPALVDGLSGRSVSYGDLIRSADEICRGFIATGLHKGDVCAVLSPNEPEFASIFYGVIKAGGVITSINPLYSVAELTHQLRDSGARYLVCAPELLAKAQPAAARAGIEELFTLGDAARATGLSALIARGSDDQSIALPVIDPTADLAVLPYSSGTTGLPKGVMLTHRNLVTSVTQWQAVEQMAPEEVLLAALPFYHIYGMVCVMTAGLHAGTTLVTLPRFDARTFCAATQKYRITTAYLVPPMVRTLAKHPVVDEYDMSSLQHIVSSAAPLPESMAQLCTQRIGRPVRQAYGMTEASPSTHLTPRGNPRAAPVGLPLPNTEFRIVDVDQQHDVAVDEIGEVWIRGPQLMRGYLNNPDATRTMIDDEGWLHTGDIGYADKDGYLFVVDRAKELTKFKSLQYADSELLLAMVEDITTRRDATRRVTFQTRLLDSVRESVVATEADGRISFWNKGAEALFGFPADEALGAPLEALIIPDDVTARKELREELAIAALSGKWQGQAPRRRRDGSVLWTDLVVSRMTQPDGHPAGFIAIHRDITELRANQEMIRDSRERMQNLASSLLVAREQERAAIARDLHDDIGQALTRLRIDLCWLIERVPKRLRTRRSKQMTDLIDSLVRRVQHISSELRPPVLDDFGLEAAIEWQARQFADWNSCACVLDLELSGLHVHRNRDTVVFRIVQEALTNVARHSQARNVLIRGRVAAGELRVQIDDDGVGFAEAKLQSPQSLGLISMRERAESIGGQLEIVSGAGKGTTVSVRTPVDQPELARSRR